MAKKQATKDDPSTPFYDARNSQGQFSQESEEVEIIDNAEANRLAEERLVKGQWEQAKRLGLLDQGEGLKKSYEHDGLNDKRPEGL